MRAALLILVALRARSAALLLPTDVPPVLNTPVYSLATLNNDGSTNMNILTYATPVGVQPRLWAVSLFRKTLSRDNFVARKGGVLQLLCDSHAPLTYSLGGLSGRDVDKASTCAGAGFPWMDAIEDGHPQLLPGCAMYVRLEQVGELQAAGEHDVALCRVAFYTQLGEPPSDGMLSSSLLRAENLITDRGRAIEPDA